MNSLQTMTLQGVSRAYASVPLPAPLQGWLDGEPWAAG
jgi:hypothetical protein